MGLPFSLNLLIGGRHGETWDCWCSAAWAGVWQHFQASRAPAGRAWPVLLTFKQGTAHPDRSNRKASAAHA